MEGKARFTGVLSRAILIACTAMAFAARPTPCAAQAEATPAPTPDPRLKELGLLDTQVTQVRRPNCWSLTLRGKLKNPYDEKVEGVRLIVRLRQSGEDPKVLERIEVATGMDIDAQGSVNFSRELSTGCTTTFNDLSIVAFATKRGGSQLGTPDLDLEIAAAKVQEAASSGGGLAPLGNVGSWAVGVR